jgi:hypothetical protein
MIHSFKKYMKEKINFVTVLERVTSLLTNKRYRAFTKETKKMTESLSLGTAMGRHYSLSSVHILSLLGKYDKSLPVGPEKHLSSSM